MRKIFAVIVMFFLCVKISEAATKFVAFPTVRVCTEANVRYRGNPDTDSDIWGRLNVGEKVIVEGQTAVDGKICYEISPKNAQDSAFVFGKYLIPYYDNVNTQPENLRLLRSK